MIKECHVSENLFDKDTMVVPWYIDTQGRVVASSGGSYSIVVPCNPNATYSCSFPELPQQHLVRVMTFSEYPSVDDYGQNYSGIGSGIDEFSYTTNNTAAYMMVFLWNTAAHPDDMTYTEFFSQTMLNLGSSILPYEPYGNTWNTKSYCKATTGSKTYSNLPIVVRSREQSISSWNMKGNEQHTGTASPTSPIEINGTGERTANLFDYKTAYSAYVQPNGDVTATAAQIYAVQNVYGSGLIGTEVTMSVKVKTCGSTYVSIRAFINGARVDGNTIARGNTGTLKITVTPETASDYWFITYGSGGTDTYSDFMQNTGSTVQSYEPYGYKIPISSGGTTTPVYLSEPLMKIGDSVDSLASSGTVTYNIKKVEFKGTETTWERSSSYSGGFYMAWTNATLGGINYGEIVCSHATFTSAIQGYVYGTCYSDGSLNIRIMPEGSTLDEWKAYLAQEYANGTPVTAYFIRSTPTTETVTAPTIPTTSSPTTIDVNTSVKPSEMSLTYDGYKICKEQKYQNNAWT